MNIKFMFLKKSLKIVIYFLALFFLFLNTIIIFATKSKERKDLNDDKNINTFNTLQVQDLNPEPGKRTLKNFLKTGLSRVATSLYVFGGGWGEESHKIGPNKKMEKFLKSQNSDYNCLTIVNGNLPTGFDCMEALKIGNKKFISSLGVDCAGFIGWTIYNTLHDKSDISVIKSKEKLQGNYSTSKDSTYVCDFMRIDLEKRNILKFKKMTPVTFAQITPGDILTGSGHIWINLGICSDKSMVMLHSTSIKGEDESEKGGIMISGTETPEGKQDSEALKLATYYMSICFPEYHEKFKNWSAKENKNWHSDIKIFCPFYSKSKKYIVSDFEGTKYIGKWQILQDEENIKIKSPEEILRLFLI